MFKNKELINFIWSYIKIFSSKCRYYTTISVQFYFFLARYDYFDNKSIYCIIKSTYTKLELLIKDMYVCKMEIRHIETHILHNMYKCTHRLMGTICHNSATHSLQPIIIRPRRTKQIRNIQIQFKKNILILNTLSITNFARCKKKVGKPCSNLLIYFTCIIHIFFQDLSFKNNKYKKQKTSTSTINIYQILTTQLDFINLKTYLFYSIKYTKMSVMVVEFELSFSFFTFENPYNITCVNITVNTIKMAAAISVDLRMNRLLLHLIHEFTCSVYNINMKKKKTLKQSWPDLDEYIIMSSGQSFA
ncbi:hypothetical protein AGLY_012328 [Aphis glycines]|uniref:Uncharacterized protein n=1 Tax=Aphis glycines TaxID=307491 RepID=A0A6G0T9S7_APHGL|nr:hypothetical protein AGLY_012328 [Aphis glycines]